MLCPGLSLVGLLCTVAVLLLTDGSWGKETSLNHWGPSTALRHQQHLELRKLCAYKNESEGKPDWIQGLNNVTLKLSLILEKYDQKRGHLDELYHGVANCGLSNCGKYPPNVLPEKMKPNEFNCKKFKDLRKWTSEILSKGYTGSKTCEDQFKELIRCEENRTSQQQLKNNESRLTILRELQNEIKVLRVNICEVKIMKTKERLNTCESARKIASNNTFSKDSSTTAFLETSKTISCGIAQGSAKTREISQTELKIREWGILQQSKEYLSLFCESLQLVYKCWEERKLSKKRTKKKKNRRKMWDKEKWRYHRAENTKNGNY